MATTQMSRSAASGVSLPNRVGTEQQSLVLVKRLLAVSVSCITYLRGLFPEYAYATRYLEDMCVKILREDKSCPGAAQMVKWLLGCYDALQRKYLRMVVLTIYTNIEDPQTVTECYQFRFKYTPGGPVMDFSSTKGSSVSACSDVKKASILLMRKLYILMQNLGPLPSEVCVTMKLYYYDEVTPTDYQPPGFKEDTKEGMMFEGDPVHLNVGEVATPFHSLKVRVTTDKERMEHAESTILKDAPTHAVKLDMDELRGSCAHGEPLHPALHDPPSSAQNMDLSSLHVEDLELKDIDQVNPVQPKNSLRDHFQKDKATTTSWLEDDKPPANEYRTRSGRIIPAKNSSQESVKMKTSNACGGQKRKAGKKAQAMELSDSQEEPVVAKRRKSSSSKDTYHC